MDGERRMKLALAALARQEKRDLKAAEKRRTYMREYMRKRRGTDTSVFALSSAAKKDRAAKQAISQRERRRAYSKERYIAQNLAIRVFPGVTAADEQQRREWVKAHMRKWGATP